MIRGHVHRSRQGGRTGPAAEQWSSARSSDHRPDQRSGDPRETQGSVSVVTSWPARMMSTSDTVVLHPDRDDTPGWETVHIIRPSVRPSSLARSIAGTYGALCRATAIAPHTSRRRARSICLLMAHVRSGRQKARQNRPSLALYMCGVGRSPQSAWKMLNLLRVEHGIGRRQCDTIVSRAILLLLHHHTIEYY
jgi:hypothetical protein